MFVFCERLYYVHKPYLQYQEITIFTITHWITCHAHNVFIWCLLHIYVHVNFAWAAIYTEKANGWKNDYKISSQETRLRTRMSPLSWYFQTAQTYTLFPHVLQGGNSVSVLTPQGEKIRTFTPKAPGKGLLGNAWGVAVDASDNIYVADGSSNRIQKFNSKGEFVAAVGSKGSGKHRFDGVIDICYNKRSNYLFVPDQNNHRVKVLTTDLKFVHSFDTRKQKCCTVQHSTR